MVDIKTGLISRTIFKPQIT